MARSDDLASVNRRSILLGASSLWQIRLTAGKRPLKSTCKHMELIRGTGHGSAVRLFGSGEMAGRNSDVPDSRIEFRIGINVGDIVVEDGDIFGDGVNIAARLESLAEPGGICVSARVREDAAGKLDLAFRDLGEQQLKNIERPVRAYAVGEASSPTRHRHRRIVKRTLGPTATASFVVGPPLVAAKGRRRRSRHCGSPRFLLLGEPFHRAGLGRGLSRLWLAGLRGRCGSAAEEPMVCRLTAGASRIRTLSPTSRLRAGTPERCLWASGRVETRIIVL